MRSRPPARAPSTPAPTASSWARARPCSCSSGSRTPSATATGSTPSSSASAGPRTARARASRPPTRSGSSSPSSAPGSARASTPRPPAAVEAHGTSTRVGDAVRARQPHGGVRRRRGGPAARSHSARSSRTSATSRRRPGRPGCSRWCARCTRRCSRRACNFEQPEPQRRLGHPALRRQHRPAPVARPPRTTCAAAASARSASAARTSTSSLEEHVPGRHRPPARSFASAEVPARSRFRHPPLLLPCPAAPPPTAPKAPLRGALVLGGRDDADVGGAGAGRPGAGRAPGRPRRAPHRTRRWRPRPCGSPSTSPTQPTSPTKLDQAGQGVRRRATPRPSGCCASRASSSAAAPRRRSPSSTPARARSTSTCSSPWPRSEPIVADDLRRGRPGDDPAPRPDRSRSFIFIDGDDPAAVTQARAGAHADRDHPARGARRPTSPSTGCSRPTASQPDMVMGHSLGEYGALVAAGVADLRRRPRGGQRARPRDDAVSVADNGTMAAVFAPLAEIERIVDGDRRLRRRRQHQQHQPGRDRRRHRRRRAARSSAFTAAGSRPRASR